MLKKSKSYVAQALLMALVVTTFTACAGQDTGGMPSGPESEAALLDDAEAATPVADTSGSVFADLAPGAPEDTETAAADALSTEPTAAAGDLLADAASGTGDASVTNDAFAGLEKGSSADTAASAATESSGEPFYNPIGGEKLGHVAYVLYGNRAKAKQLQEQNPSLSPEEKLSAEQKVFFQFEGMRPQVRLLSKDLIDRYPAQLAEKVERATTAEAKSKVTVGPGETLQALSQRLYGTTRYWTEIYLLNQASITNYDKVPAGLELTVVQRDPAAVPAPIVADKPKAPKVAAAPKKEEAPKPVEAPKAAEPAPVAPAPIPEPVVAAPVAAPTPPPMDPIPETSAPVAQPVVESPAFPAAVHNEVAPGNGATMGSVKEFLANGANVRRLVYVISILIIGIAAFFLTRTKKKSFDMLDMTTSDTAPRPKLGGKDDKKFG